MNDKHGSGKSYGDSSGNSSKVPQQNVEFTELNVAAEMSTRKPQQTRAADNDESVDAAPPSLAERRITVKTRKHFGIMELAGMGYAYTAESRVGSPAVWRIRSSRVGEPPYRWLGDKDSKLPDFYNRSVLLDTKSLEKGLYIVGDELDVWTMHQNGFAAISLYGALQDPALLAPHMEPLRAQRVTPHVLYHNDEAGRKGAVQLAKALRKMKIYVEVRILSGRNGYSISELFADCGFNQKKFEEAIETLPFLPPPALITQEQVEEWILNPISLVPDKTGAGAANSEDGDSETDIYEDLMPCLDEWELASLPLPKCRIDGILLKGRPTLFTGPYSTGKSAIALDWGLCISTGRDWCGHATHQGEVAYLAAEGAHGIKLRLEAWKKYHGVESVPGFHVIPEPALLTDPEQLARLIKTIRYHSPNPALVVLDTLSRTSTGLNDSLTADMTIYLEAVEEICRQLGAAVLIIHHNNRSHNSAEDSYRGSSVLPANTDGYLVLMGKTDAECVKLKVIRIKDFAAGEVVPLQRQVIHLPPTTDDAPESGVPKPNTSVVFVSDTHTGEKNPTGQNQSSRGTKRKREASKDGLTPKEADTLEALRSIGAVGAGRSDANSSDDDSSEADGGFKAVTSREWREAAATAEVSESAFIRAKRKLLAGGWVGEVADATGAARYALCTQPEVGATDDISDGDLDINDAEIIGY